MKCWTGTKKGKRGSNDDTTTSQGFSQRLCSNDSYRTPGVWLRGQSSRRNQAVRPSTASERRRRLARANRRRRLAWTDRRRRFAWTDWRWGITRTDHWRCFAWANDWRGHHAWADDWRSHHTRADDWRGNDTRADDWRSHHARANDRGNHADAWTDDWRGHHAWTDNRRRRAYSHHLTPHWRKSHGDRGYGAKGKHYARHQERRRDNQAAGRQSQRCA